MSSTLGHKLTVTVFGQSHSPAIGAVIDGFPPGLKLDMEKIRAFMARRAPGRGDLHTPRTEADKPVILSGLCDGITCAAPLSVMIENTNTRPSDYDRLKDYPRPGHSDYPAHVRSKGYNDVSGGGHFSGRLTAPLCFAGALCMQYLEEQGIHVGAHISSISGIADDPFDPVTVRREDFAAVQAKAFPVLNDEKGAAMQQAILTAKAEGDSVGGVVECAVTGLPVGLGSPMFGTLEGRLSYALFGIPAVKGVEFGSGFAGATLRGSVNNDGYIVDETDAVRTVTNHAGGILGGLTSGMPLILRAAFKPTPSIAKPQQSFGFSDREMVELSISGRHDPCVVPRALPAVEAVAAITVMDILLEG